MLLSQAIQDLQNLTKQKISYEQIAQVLGVSKQAIGNRVQRNSKIQEFEWNKLKEHFGGFNQEVYIENLVNEYVENFKGKNFLPENVIKVLLSYYEQGIDLNWLITGEGEKYRKKEPAGLKDEIKQAVREMIASGELKDEFK